MKNISFRVRDEDYQRLVEALNCKPTQYFSRQVRLLVGSENTMSEEVDTESLKTTLPVKSFVTQAQYNELMEASKRNGWSLSKEIRYRLEVATPDRLNAHAELTQLLKNLDKSIMNAWLNDLLEANRQIKLSIGFMYGNREVMKDEMDALRTEFKRIRREVSKFRALLNDLKAVSERV
ncbi:hypothetical protein KS551_004562, partial [Salmonella enterica]|nr:hypothetical protein [Salmonella enterica]EHQ9695649.1 hypothetical protein [Salmonella enterica]